MPQHQPSSINGISDLELIMRDVLDGMEDLVSEFAFQSDTAEFEIIAIEAPEEYVPIPAKHPSQSRDDQLGAA